MLTKKEKTTVDTWLKQNNVLSISMVNPDDVEFSSNGCDALGNELADNVYLCEAAYLDTDWPSAIKIFNCDLSQETICYITNGE